MMQSWNPWHGCRKISPGCAHCYVYRRDESVGRDASQVYRTRDFELPIRRGRDGGYKLLTGADVFACGTSDFFLEQADDWRADAWAMIKARPDCRFLIITKRIGRFRVALPEDFPLGFGHVTIGCTCEDQRRADERLPVFLAMPIQNRSIICEPLLGPIELRRYLGPRISQLVVGGESGEDARDCDYDWVLRLRDQCLDAGVRFHFKQTGKSFVKDGKRYQIPRSQQMRQARRAGIDTF